MSSPMHSVDELVETGTREALEASIGSATRALLKSRQPDGHWVFELEADSTIPAEYVLLGRYLGEPVNASLEAKIASYLRRVQGAHGGWPLVHDGDFDMSASVKSYLALKLIGDSPDAPHMVRARGLARCPPHGASARGDAFARRSDPQQRIHAFHAGAVRRHDLAQRAGAAGRDHAAADVVAVSYQQDLVLGAHHDRSTDGSGSTQATRAQCRAHKHR